MTKHWSGRWALITGASAGLGKAFAVELAAGGTHLILTARRMARLNELAAQLRSSHGVRVECVEADLEQPDGPDRIFAFTGDRKLEIDLLINNAGFGAYGEFREIDGGRQVNMVRLNCEAVVHLTYLYLPVMVDRKRGDILILASTASFQAVPYMSVYAASKAFDLLFAEGLAEEVKPYGLRVCALCPGPTESEFQEVAGTPNRALRHMETAEKVVRVGLEALAAGKHSVISGFQNQLGAEIQRLAPRRVVTSMVAKLYAPKAKT